VVVQVDHRRLAAPGLQTEQLYFCAADGRPAFEAMCERLMGTAASDLATVSGQVDVPVRQGRTMKVERAAGGVCRFKFADLCGADVGAADFGALASSFHTIILDGVPQLSTSEHNQAARFVILIDEMYENRCKLACFCVVPLAQLFDDSTGIVLTDDAAPATPFVRGFNHELATEKDAEATMVPSTTSSNDPALPDNQVAAHHTTSTPLAVDPASEELAVSGAEFAAIHELRLAFSRAASRLTEMMSPDYTREA
jgi:protein AFG1